MIDQIEQEAKQRMQKSIEALRGELVKLRTGRAHPNLLDQIMVSYYGTDTPLSQVSSVSIEGPRTILVTPWEKNIVADVEKAIRNSNLGLNPATSGQVIRVPLPPLTEERRKELVKIVKQEAENGRVSIRNIRRDANNKLKELLKAKELSEDEEHRGQDLIQKITDKFIEEVEAIFSTKEKELMEI